MVKLFGAVKVCGSFRVGTVRVIIEIANTETSFTVN